MAVLDFDMTAQEKPQYQPIPSGEYLCKIASCDDHVGKESGKTSLKLSLIISEGEFTGKTMNKYISVYSEDQTTQKKAIDLVRHIVHCVGLTSIKDTNELASYDIVAVVKCAQRKDSDQMESSVIAFKKVETETASAVAEKPKAQAANPFAKAAPKQAVKSSAVDDDVPF